MERTPVTKILIKTVYSQEQLKRFCSEGQSVYKTLAYKSLPEAAWGVTCFLSVISSTEQWTGDARPLTVMVSAEGGLVTSSLATLKHNDV